MARRCGEGAIYIGRLDKNVRSKDLEGIFDRYGKLLRCEVKYGTSTRGETAFAFIDYEDRRDAEDAIKYEHGREFAGQRMIVEWAKGNPFSRDNERSRHRSPPRRRSPPPRASPPRRRRSRSPSPRRSLSPAPIKRSRSRSPIPVRRSRSRSLS